MEKSKNKPVKKEQHSLKIDGQLWVDLEDLALQQNRSKNNLIETVLKDYVTKNHPTKK